MKHEESKIQCEIVRYLQDQKIFCFSVPNEGAGSNAIRAGQMVTMGMKSGVSDLVAFFPDGIVFIEVKTKTGKQSPAQVKFEARCKEEGYPYYLVRSVEDVKSILDAKNSPLNASFGENGESIPERVKRNK